MILILFSLSLANATVKNPPLELGSNGTVIENCITTKEQKKYVHVFQQWHLPPSEKTDITSGKFPEQEENQTAIYEILEEWIGKSNFDTVIAEGCEGEITSSFSKEFNGWDFSKLKEQVNNPLYKRITTHIPLKLEVKFTDKVKTLCGDSDKIIDSSNLYFSDIRGFGGFLARIQQLKDTEQQRTYLKLAKEVLKISQDTKTETVIQKLKDAIKDRVSKIKNSINQRNDFFVKKVLSQNNYSSALVIGGAHVKDLKIKFEKAGIGCQIIKPKGYNFDPEQMFEKLSSL